MTQLPSHLVGWMVPGAVRADSGVVEGDLRCPCGSDRLEFHRAGTYQPAARTGMEFAVQAVCPACGRACLVFDSGRHGWDALEAARQRALRGGQERPCSLPFARWQCRPCGASVARAVVRLTVPTDVQYLERWGFDASQPLEAFTIIAIDLTCGACSQVVPAWARYQTEGFELTNPYLPLSMELTVLWDGMRIGQFSVQKRSRRSPALFGAFLSEPGPAGLPPLLVEAQRLHEDLTTGVDDERRPALEDRDEEITNEIPRHLRLAELPADVGELHFEGEGAWIVLERMTPSEFARRHPPRCIRELCPTVLTEAVIGLPAGEVSFRLRCPCGERSCYVLGYFWAGEGRTPQHIFASPLALECPRCGRVSEVIDTRQHGHDGEQGSDCNQTGEGPRVRFPCPHCGEAPLAVIAGFDYGGHEYDPLDPAARPQDFFGVFSLYGECGRCGRLVKVTDFECA